MYHLPTIYCLSAFVGSAPPASHLATHLPTYPPPTLPACLQPPRAIDQYILSYVLLLSLSASWCLFEKFHQLPHHPDRREAPDKKRLPESLVVVLLLVDVVIHQRARAQFGWWWFYIDHELCVKVKVTRGGLLHTGEYIDPIRVVEAARATAATRESYIRALWLLLQTGLGWGDG